MIRILASDAYSGFYATRKYELADMPYPACGADWVIVAVKSTSICAMDVKILHGTVLRIPGYKFDWGAKIGGRVQLQPNTYNRRRGILALSQGRPAEGS